MSVPWRVNVLVRPAAVHRDDARAVRSTLTSRGTTWWGDRRRVRLRRRHLQRLLLGLGVTASNIVSIVSTPYGGGYWLVGSDGGVFAFGDATSQGSLPGLGVSVNNIVGSALVLDEALR